MTGFEYKVVPAPIRGLKAKGVKGTPARFANALQTVMNDLGAEGWEYQRTDTLPVEERQGLTGKSTSFQNMLVFRRVLNAPVEDTAEVAALIEDQSEVLDEPEPIEEPQVEDAPVEDIAASTEGAVAESPQDPEQVAAQDRVSATLKAPFAFPWNNRAANKAGKDTGDTDNNIPAE
ncbi:DUF4177 domain-containing protein [Octadecabacter sp. G9-8]|uniref:DUF4177 domain-containing protein n=1 Tax=Octadecabacter dasysiphoniae TaxID=2909341 RepID=A0ABS9CUZ4_9RHOB|nr:DUF4177 domain-containing protein [Octadecabacter dasysiphoniae]MCF2870240.1 DUF4177 domain-containing protein [Octadecabacter dasysiphoniae]